MAKIRVYELARDLNMKNKVLLEKLSDMNISVRSHMSSLDDEIVATIKANLFGAKTDTVDVKRVRPTVIRRRKKRPQEEPAETQSALTPELYPEKVEVAEQPSEKAIEEKQEPVKAAKEELIPEKPAVEVAVSSEIAPTEEKLIEKAQEPESTLTTKKARPKPIVFEPEKPATIKKPKSGKKVKKVKKEVPAKIIKLPIPPPEEKTPEVSKIQVAEPGEKISEEFFEDKVDFKKEILVEEKPIKEKKKKPKKKEEEVAVVEDIITDKKFFKKKISFRKKEVVEGKDLYSGKHRGRKTRKSVNGKTAQGQKPQITTPKAIKRRIKIDETIALSDLAKRMGIKVNEMIKRLMSMGVMVTVNQTIDFDTAVLVASEFEYELEKASFEEETFLKAETDEPDKLIERPPVVTIMGHVDHGKTSLLDVIRKTKITEIEAGGITQHIGAYHVSTDKGQIVFLDTPGHEAFTAMRSRGAGITDLVVLVVAADDGVMPQTIEAINHSKAAGVPIIVAINKIDKANAEPERVQRELAEVGLVPEEWGGDTIFVKVSAKRNQGIDELLEMILLQAELLELKANPDKHARGHVIEAKLDSGRGAVATVLVHEGTLHLGEPVVCGIQYGKVRAMLNDRGIQVESAGPSIPVEVVGLSGVPMAGDEFIALDDDRSAKQVSLHRIQKQRSKELAKTSRLSLEKLYEKMQEGEVKELNLIIKADVNGSIEALKDSLTKLSTDEVKINIIHSATGTVAESDVSLASVSDAIILGFNVRPSSKVQDFANEENVDMRFYNIIYNVIKDIKDSILGLMSSTFEERILGRATVREVFHVPKVGAIAGCYVTDGKIERGQLLRLIRDGVVCYDGKLSSLRRFKDDVKEVQSGYECGIGIENYNDIKIGDIIECYFLEEIKPELE
ncbi:MAG: translation initiation factor IF-2 [Desulfobacterales bacterium]|nr:translation initiation factor IF-2 [Desulfobacterales bacterium]